MTKAFADSNVVLYLLSTDSAKADHAEAVLEQGVVLSVQVLNEVANVMRRKLNMPWDDVNQFLTLVRALCPVEPLTLETHDKGRFIAERYGISLYDAMIVAAALLAKCDTLYSEDMHGGLLIEHQLRIQDPFS